MVVQLLPISGDSCSMNKILTGGAFSSVGVRAEISRSSVLERAWLGMTHPLHQANQLGFGERSMQMSAIPFEPETSGQGKTHDPIPELIAQ